MAALMILRPDDTPERRTAALRSLADRIQADGPSAVAAARQRALDAIGTVAAALTEDPTVAEREMRNLDLLHEIMRRLAPLGRQTLLAAESARLTAAGQSTAHLGRVNPLAADELDSVSARCEVFASAIRAAVHPDWDSPERVRELSASRMPDEHWLAEIADSLRSALAPALDLPHPDPEAVRLSAVADQISPSREIP
jgi:hypothetical protein